VKKTTLSPDARSALIEAHVPLALSMARKHATRSAHLKDLRSAAFEGLCDAAERFDPERGTRFATYARPWITKRLCEAAAYDAGAERRALRHYREAESELFQSLGRQPTLDEIAEASGLTRTTVDGIARVVEGNARWGGEWRTTDPEAFGLAPAAQPSVPGLDFEREQAVALVERLLVILDPRSREVVELRYGIAQPKALTLRETASKIGVSHETVRVVEREALAAMSRWLRLMGITHHSQI
jgi:RNA polymerase nonessential primary-like sigma factor